MRKIDAMLVADTFDVLMTKLEAFADHFEHLATTAEQRELAVEFHAFVGELVQEIFLPGEEMDRHLTAAIGQELVSALHGHETMAGLYAEIQADEAARIGVTAEWYGKESLKSIRAGSRETPASEPALDHGIER
jgi:hypothetical protein